MELSGADFCFRINLPQSIDFYLCFVLNYKKPFLYKTKGR